MSNIVYVATSLDGFIADKDNKLDWLHNIPNPEKSDFGYGELMASVDALVMGRNTFETILGFNCDWPYNKPVFVLSDRLTEIPKGYEDKAFLLKGTPQQISENLNSKGYNKLYIDGGVTIQNFLKQDMIDELIITTIPILLGGGIPLFGELSQPTKFRHTKSERYADSIVKNYFVRER